MIELSLELAQSRHSTHSRNDEMGVVSGPYNGDQRLVSLRSFLRRRTQTTSLLNGQRQKGQTAIAHETSLRKLRSGTGHMHGYRKFQSSAKRAYRYSRGKCERDRSLAKQAHACKTHIRDHEPDFQKSLILRSAKATYPPPLSCAAGTAMLRSTFQLLLNQRRAVRFFSS